MINGHPFKVIGTLSRQGTFLGLFSLDSIVVIPLPAFKKYFSAKSEADVRVKVRDKTHMADARDELTGIMRRLRSLPPEKKDDFSINEQQAFKSTLDAVKTTIAIAGLFITGLVAFRRRDRDHEHHFREREGADERDRDAQSVRRAAPHDPPAVPDRIDRALPGRRADRADLCLPDVFRNGRGVSFLSDPLFVRPGYREHDRLGLDRAGLGDRAGLVGLAARSGDGAAV